MFNLNLRHIFTLSSSVFLCGSHIPSLLFSYFLSGLSLSSHFDLSDPSQLLFSRRLTFVQRKRSASPSWELDCLPTYQVMSRTRTRTVSTWTSANLCSSDPMWHIYQHRGSKNPRTEGSWLNLCAPWDTSGGDTPVHSHFHLIWKQHTLTALWACVWVCCMSTKCVPQSICEHVFLRVFTACVLTPVCVRMCSEGTDYDCSLWVLAFGAGSACSGQGRGI